MAEAEEAAEEEGTLVRRRRRIIMFGTNKTRHILFTYVHDHTRTMQVLHTLSFTTHTSPHLHPNCRILKCTLRTNQDQLLLRARESHVDPPPIFQQHSNLSLILSSSPHILLHITSHQRDDDTILISSLKAIHRRHFQKAALTVTSVGLVSTVHSLTLSYNLQYFRRHVERNATCAE